MERDPWKIFLRCSSRSLTLMTFTLKLWKTEKSSTLMDLLALENISLVRPSWHISIAFLLILSFFFLQPVGPSVTYGTIPVFTFTFETAGLGGVSPDKKRKLSTTAVAEGVRSQRVVWPHWDLSIPF
jgi:hypothetical protein